MRGWTAAHRQQDVGQLGPLQQVQVGGDDLGLHRGVRLRVAVAAALGDEPRQVGRHRRRHHIPAQLEHLQSGGVMN